ncbi:UNVERIFIED_ORG: hypothetical protein FHW05_004599, partial [Pantoea agglomerans]
FDDLKGAADKFQLLRYVATQRAEFAAACRTGNLALEEVGGNLGSKGKLERDPNKNIIFILDKSALPTNSKFKNPSDCQDLVDDVEKLHEWLVKHEFIDDEVPTPKFISTTDLIF